MINKASIYSLIVNKTINFEKTNDELMNMIMREKYHFEKNEKYYRALLVWWLFYKYKCL